MHRLSRHSGDVFERDRIALIARHNDNARTCHGRSNAHVLVVTSDGVNALLDHDRDILSQLFARSRMFEALAAWMPEAHDDEHRHGQFQVDDVELAFRIDYFERWNLTKAAADPSQAHLTTRILTVMLPSE